MDVIGLLRGFEAFGEAASTLDTCIDRFANVLNFRGEPYVPGQDAMMSYPDAR